MKVSRVSRLKVLDRSKCSGAGQSVTMKVSRVSRLKAEDMQEDMGVRFYRYNEGF